MYVTNPDMPGWLRRSGDGLTDSAVLPAVVIVNRGCVLLSAHPGLVPGGASATVLRPVPAHDPHHLTSGQAST
jgi:hypothetical protein